MAHLAGKCALNKIIVRNIIQAQLKRKAIDKIITSDKFFAKTRSKAQN